MTGIKERERQIELLEMGRNVVQETRRWDDNKESSHAMRSKEDAPVSYTHLSTIAEKYSNKNTSDTNKSAGAQ